MEINRIFCGLALLPLLLTTDVLADESFSWPGGQAMAVSLSYDDALDSQLDNAVPALNRRGLAASFYLTLASPTVRQRLGEWRAAAKQGHELGNHTVFHPCSAALPDRSWVKSYYDSDNYALQEIVDEINVANSFLYAIDGQTERTLTVPCGDTRVSGEDYVPTVRPLFIAIKGFESEDPTFADWWAPAEISGPELVDRIEAEAASGTRLFNIILHGVGGDYLAVSEAAHEHLLDYLAANQATYWVDTYIDIMKYAAGHRAPGVMQ